MFTNDKKKKWKKILGITTGIGLALVAGVGIGFSSYYVSQNSFVADDLSEGRSIKLDFNLVDANNEFVLDVAKEEGLLKESSDFLVSTLEDKGLTNISVSYGFEFREIPKSSLITLELTSNAFDFGKGLNLHDIVDNNNQPLNTSIIVKTIFNNKNIMLYNSDKITNENMITINHLEADFNNNSLSFYLTVGDLIKDKKVKFFGFNNGQIPDLNPVVKLVDGKPVATLRIGMLSASFENSLSSFSLRDVEDEVNTLFNDHQTYKNLSFSNRYSLEPIRNRYSGIEYSTGRTNSHLFVDASTLDEKDPNKIPLPYKDDLSYFLINDKQNIDGSIERYVDKDGKTSDTLVNIKSYNTYNSGSFVIDINAYNKLLASEQESSSGSQPTTYEDSTITPPDEGGETEEKPTGPVPSEQFQTTSSWILWNDKQGFINYLNQLIISWYFNMYANIPLNANGTPKIVVSETRRSRSLDSRVGDGYITVNKDNWKEQLFSTGEYDYANYLSRDVRNSINAYLSSLEDIEKQFMSFVAYDSDWLPEPITEDNLIQTLFEFYDASLNGKPEDSFDSNNSSPSEISGWGWLESDASDNVVKTLSKDYLVSFIDYRNYDKYFVNPNPPDTEAEDYKPTDPINPFYVRNFTFASDFYNSELFVNVLNNENYKFPLVSLFNNDSFTSGWTSFANELAIKSSEFAPPSPKDYPTIDEYNDALDDYFKTFNDECKKIANNFLKPSLLFGQQNITKPKIDKSITGLEPLAATFVTISVVIFLVGIFVSVYFRIPGFIAFVLSALTYVLSLLFYSNFGFVYSFFSLMSAAFGAFISFITSFFYLNNFKKEIFENSSITGATIKSIKKYWKTSLDLHIVLLITSLAFLFFGQINNVNFGAMLIVSVFLSFILSGVIFYVLILLFVIVFDMNNEKMFMTQKQYKYLLKLEYKKESKLLQNKFFGSLRNFFIDINYFDKKKNIVIFSILFVVAFVGIFIFCFIGPIYSLDFTSSSVISIYNFDTVNLSKAEIIDVLGISSINNYIYDNELIIYANNRIDQLELLNRILNSGLNDTVKANLINNITSSVLSSEINTRLVFNTLKCIGIGIGFSTIWILVSLNFIAIVPIIISQISILFIIVGWVGISRMPFDINGIIIFVFVFLVSTALSIASVSSSKKSWNKKIQIDIKNFKSLINSILMKINKNLVFINLIVLLFSVLGMVLISPTLIFTFLILALGSIINMIILNRIVILLWFYANLLKNKFTQEIQVVRVSKLNRANNRLYCYDYVNEQNIKGLNC